MTQGNSRSISTSQLGPHNKVPELVTRHLTSTSQKPFNQHTLEAFEQVQDWLNDWQGPLILDSCCGVGESTATLAKQFPDARVIGVDKSALRTGKHQAIYHQGTDNHLVVRADLNDFWRLAHQAGWRLERHYLLYPNPYPKPSQVHRRWHASAAFADILKLGGRLEVRSNWDIYIEEFAIALQTAGIAYQSEVYSAAHPITPFERKYWASGQQSFRVVADI
jgi:tRNA (guanine-N7-)-methyltransferase